MNKQEYIANLKIQLKDEKYETVCQVIEYYEEIIDDCIEEFNIIFHYYFTYIRFPFMGFFISSCIFIDFKYLYNDLVYSYCYM